MLDSSSVHSIAHSLTVNHRSHVSRLEYTLKGTDMSQGWNTLSKAQTCLKAGGIHSQRHRHVSRLEYTLKGTDMSQGWNTLSKAHICLKAGIHSQRHRHVSRLEYTLKGTHMSQGWNTLSKAQTCLISRFTLPKAYGVPWTFCYLRITTLWCIV